MAKYKYLINLKTKKGFILVFFAGIGIFFIILLGENFIHEYFEIRNFNSQGNYDLAELVLLGWTNSPCSSPLSYNHCTDGAIGAWNIGRPNFRINYTFNNLWDWCWAWNLTACYQLTKINWLTKPNTTCTNQIKGFDCQFINGNNIYKKT